MKKLLPCPALGAGIHVLIKIASKTSMAGTGPGHDAVSAAPTTSHHYRRGAVSGLDAGADHEVVVVEFRDLPPFVFEIAERLDVVPDLLEVRIGGGNLGIDLVRRLQAGLHHRLREDTQLRAFGYQIFQRCRIDRVVLYG